jgi:hypothetical protein
MPDFSFFRYEISVVCLLVVYVFYAYAPGPVLRPTADVDGVLASFTDSTVIAGVERPFFFGLATAAAHVEDQARARRGGRARGAACADSPRRAAAGWLAGFCARRQSGRVLQHASA